MDLKQSETAKNLMGSFIGESLVRNRYTYYASRAKKDGYEYIGNIFEETAKNEQYHAKRFLSSLLPQMEGEKVTIEKRNYPVELGGTYENLLSAAEGEREEAFDIYPAFAEKAREEGFIKEATYFTLIAKVEEFHHKRFIKLAEEFDRGFFTREADQVWICQKCGHHHTGSTPPAICPICAHDRGYFKPGCKCEEQ